MPYNPSSAYPRHTTYVPPIFDRGFARGINEPNWMERFAHPMGMPAANVGHAIERGAAGASKEAIGLTMEAMNRPGVMSMLHAGVRRGAQATGARKIWNKAEYGDDPNETAASAEAGEESPQLIIPTNFRDKGGRAHTGIVSDRLGAMSQRQETMSGLDEVVGNVLGGKSGGPMKVPQWRGGWSRRRGGA